MNDTTASTTAPMETMTKNRVYVTISNDTNKPKYVTYYDKENKRYKQLDLSGSALGAYGQGTVYMSNKYAKNPNMTKAMKDAAKEGFHPKIGKKTGAEAVTAHELGHYLSDRAMRKAKVSEKEIVGRAAKKIGVKVNNMAGLISKYARYNYAETIAEASADVYANGRRASKASKAIMSEIKSILR